MANAEIIAVGSELLTPQRVDTNSLTITEQLNALGVEVVRKQVVGDDRDILAEEIRVALNRSEIVVLSGGLGPTEDDVTRDAAASAVGSPLIHSPEQEAILVARFEMLRRKMAPNNRRQTFLIEGAEALPNPNGTAPGQFYPTAQGALILLPGPPRELKPMVVNEVAPRLSRILPKQVMKVRGFRVAGMGESDLDTLIAPVYTRYPNVATTVLSAPGDLWVYLRVRCATEAEADALLKEVGDPIEQLLGDRAYTTDTEEPLEAVVGRLMRERKVNVASAESCTGGLVATRLTEQPDSSASFLAGYVTYSEVEKHRLLGVPQDLLDRYGAVSEPVALAMAEGAKSLSGSVFAVSTTGFAGPGGGTEHDPVGTVYIAIAGPHGTTVRRVHHGGDRHRIRTLATQNALDFLRRAVLELQVPVG